MRDKTNRPEWRKLVVESAANSSNGLTITLTLAALLAVLASLLLAVTVAVLVNVPSSNGKAVMVIVALPPLASVPRLHAIEVGDCVQEPCVVVTSVTSNDAVLKPDSMTPVAV